MSPRPTRGRRLLRALDRAQWLGIVLLALWFIRRPRASVEPAPPPAPSEGSRRAPPTRMEELSRLPPAAARTARTLAPEMRSELSASLARVVRARALVAEANALDPRDHDGALARFREALALNPYQPEALAALGEDALGRGDRASAEGLRARCEAADPAGRACAALSRSLAEADGGTPSRGTESAARRRTVGATRGR